MKDFLKEFKKTIYVNHFLVVFLCRLNRKNPEAMIAVSEKLEEETSVVGDCPKITHDLTSSCVVSMFSTNFIFSSDYQLIYVWDTV